MEELVKTLDEADPGLEGNVQKITLLQMYKKSAINKNAGVLKDEVIGPFLVLCLSSKCEQIVKEVLQVFKIFAGCKSNHQLLMELPYFKEAIKSVYRNKSLAQNLRDDSESIIRALRKKPLPLITITSEQNQNENPSNSKATTATGESSKPTEQTGTGNNKSLATKGSRITVLYVPSVVVQERRHTITAALVKVKGIISVTYNVNKNHCIVRAKSNISQDLFGKVVANLGFDCHLIKKNEKNEHIMIEIKPDAINDSKHDQENYPDYPESDEESVPDNAIARKGGEKDEDTTLVGAVTGFFKRSFYW